MTTYKAIGNSNIGFYCSYFMQTLSVEWTGGAKTNMGKEPIRKYMEEQGFTTVSHNSYSAENENAIFFDLLFTKNV